MRRAVFVVARVLVALLVAAAVLAQLRSSLGYADRHAAGQRADVLVNFFSYFTIDSNLLSVVVLLVAAVALARTRGVEPPGLTTVRLAVTTYMVLTGVVYNLLLRGLLVQGTTVAWSNEVLHVVGPLWLALDWLLAPGRNPSGRRAALQALAFPLVWTVYTLVRGPFAHDPYRRTGHWYPYPFLNPVSSSGGYASVAAYVVGITIVVTALAFGLAWTSRRWSTTPAA